MPQRGGGPSVSPASPLPSSLPHPSLFPPFHSGFFSHFNPSILVSFPPPPRSGAAHRDRQAGPRAACRPPPSGPQAAAGGCATGLGGGGRGGRVSVVLKRRPRCPSCPASASGTPRAGSRVPPREMHQAVRSGKRRGSCTAEVSGPSKGW